MTALGTDAPNVCGLVYIAAFGIDQNETLEGGAPPTPAIAEGESNVRNAATVGRVGVRNRDGRTGVEIDPILVSRGHE